MKSAIKKRLPEWPSRPARFLNTGRAFTLIELLVVVVTVAVLSVVLLPALAGSRAQPRVTACAANFLQWAVSVNLYANDHLDSLPRFDWNGGGGNYLWDVSTNMINALGPYGLTVPMWFCPVRPNEFDAVQKQLGRPIVTLVDLTASFANNNNFNECIINHNWWVQRTSTGGPVFPLDWDPRLGPPQGLSGPVVLYGYPKRLHDNAAAHVPFISDKAGCSSNGDGFAAPASPPASANPKSCSINTAHFVNGVLLGVNAAYADGHVEAHNQSQMNCGYNQGVPNGPYWFY